MFMKKIPQLVILSTLFVSGLAVASAPTPAVAATPVPMPLSGTVELLNVNGQRIGVVNTMGLLFTRQGGGDVVSLRVVQAKNDSTRATAYRLMNSAPPALELFGPAGQRLTLNLPNLKTVQWVSEAGRITTLNLP